VLLLKINSHLFIRKNIHNFKRLWIKYARLKIWWLDYITNKDESRMEEYVYACAVYCRWIDITMKQQKQYIGDIVRLLRKYGYNASPR
jgi:hypothetical protein